MDKVGDPDEEGDGALAMLTTTYADSSVEELILFLDKENDSWCISKLGMV